jgi:asparagine synthase (glutamine-hydrolysing)
MLDGAFVFGSELKALVAWPGFRKRLDFTALADFLTFSFVPDPKTIWDGVFKLPPAHKLVVDVLSGGDIRVEAPAPWWDLQFAPESEVEDWTPRILTALTDAADEMSIADVPLGTFLSGGVDSSSVTAALSRAGHDVRSFTIGFAEAGYDERPWARRVAAQYRTEHTERLVEPADVDAVFDKLVWHFDEPFGDYSYLPTYYVSRQARQAITVSLSGDGGDEVFGGYRKYQRLALREDWGWALPRPVAAAGARLFSTTTPAFRTLQQYGAEPEAMLADSLVLGFPRGALVRETRGELARALRDYEPLDTVRGLLGRARPEQVGLVNAMRYLDFKLTLGSGILVKVDRASMAVALEVRPVYLHRALLDVATTIPPAQLADRRQAKKVLKTALAGWLPQDLLHRRKMGFAVPLAHWLRDGMAAAFSDAEGGGRLGDLFEPSLVGRLKGAHARGAADYTARIHSLVFLERWLRKWA